MIIAALLAFAGLILLPGIGGARPMYRLSRFLHTHAPVVLALGLAAWALPVVSVFTKRNTAAGICDLACGIEAKHSVGVARITALLNDIKQLVALVAEVVNGISVIPKNSEIFCCRF